MSKNQNKIWKQFNKKTIKERLEIISNESVISNNKNLENLINDTNLSVSVANNISENVIGTFSLPFSVAPYFLIDGVNYTVPMVTEEPSVVAACSYAAKLISISGGFKSIVHSRNMIGQVVLYDIPNIDTAISLIEKNKSFLLEVANNSHPSIVKRGGGIIEIYIKKIQDKEKLFLSIYFTVNTKEAMGANIVNTIAESLKMPLENITKGKTLFAILSNYATDALITVTCSIPTKLISKDIAKKIELASVYSKIDKYRAVTHNKGIFNGIDAVAIATGNDWRAIEAGGHSFANNNFEKNNQYNNYESLTTWELIESSDALRGTLTLPIHVGTVGGSINLNPKAKIALDILGNPNAKELSVILVSVGLAQNFAALKALVGDGIQKGHMKLHARSIAMQVGAKDLEIDEVVFQLTNENNHINIETAQKILQKIRNNKKK